MKSLAILLLLTLYLFPALSKLLYSNSDCCVACMGSLYTMCETAVNKFACYGLPSDCTGPNTTAKYNMWDKCNNVNGTSILSTDAQCQDQYIITKDYIYGLTPKRITVQLAKNRVCAVQIIN